MNASKWQEKKNASDVIPFTCCKLEDKDEFYKDVTRAELKDDQCQSQPNDDNSYMNKVGIDTISLLQRKI